MKEEGGESAGCKAFTTLADQAWITMRALLRLAASSIARRSDVPRTNQECHRQLCPDFFSFTGMNGSSGGFYHARLHFLSCGGSVESSVEMLI